MNLETSKLYHLTLNAEKDALLSTTAVPLQLKGGLFCLECNAQLFLWVSNFNFFFVFFSVYVSEMTGVKKNKNKWTQPFHHKILTKI